MSVEDAISFLSMVKDVLLRSNSWLQSTMNPISESFNMAIEALQKQKPEKPADDGWLYCPICGKDILMEGYKFCPDCGQAIDWSEEDYERTGN